MQIKEENFNNYIEILQIDATEEQKALGNQMSQAHISTIQRKTLIEQGRKFSNDINHGNLSFEDKLVAFRSVLWSGITYPLAVASLAKKDLHKVQQKYGVTLHHSC